MGAEFIRCTFKKVDCNRKFFYKSIIRLAFRQAKKLHRSHFCLEAVMDLVIMIQAIEMQ